MKKFILIGFLNIIVFVMPLVSRSQGVDKTKETSITYTTLDVKQDYEILQVITGYSETTTTPVNNDSFLNVYTTAWAKLAGEAYKLKSDAVIGIHVEFINGTNDLKIIVYGTAVKYK